LFKERIMKTGLFAAVLACGCSAATAQSVHVVQVINDTRSSILSFSIAPAGSHRWTKVGFGDNRPFNYGSAFNIELHDDQGCLRDFRTVLSDGRWIFARDIDVCQLHAYRPGVRYYNSRPGTAPLP
jgi:hypothetical protein